VKQKLAKALNTMMEPWRDRRAYFEAHPEQVREALAAGTARYRAAAQATMEVVRHALKLDYLE
jgi:tryptophanyl-tRNA synthetase